MRRLQERLSTYSPRDVLWTVDPIGPINVGTLIAALEGVDRTSWQDKRVAIGTLPILELVCALIFLDGLVQAILLLPDGEDAQTREARLMHAKIDTVLEGDGLGFSKLLGDLNHADSTGGALAVNETLCPTTRRTTWLMPTSGTTGAPKLVAHTISSLTRTMTVRSIGEKFTWGSLYSLRRFAGLQVFLQSWMCATPLILNEEGADLDDVLTRFINLRCNALSATPSMWRRLAMHPLFERLSLTQITLGGEIVSQPILDALKRQFPAARITHIYASTEAGVGFGVRDGMAGFPADYLKHPPLGVPMRVNERNHLEFYREAVEPAETATVCEWIDSGDVIRIDAERVFFLGRSNGSINVGGNKVMPEEVESVISEISDVAFVQVRARKSALLGSLVEAVIIPRHGAAFDSDFKKRVTTYCQGRLEDFKVPAFIVPADAIELTASGKLCRRDAT